MAALTTALGMIPLLLDAFFVAMAVTIIAGLMAATVLTMIVLPVFYSVFFRVKYDESLLDSDETTATTIDAATLEADRIIEAWQQAIGNLAIES